MIDDRIKVLFLILITLVAIYFLCFGPYQSDDKSIKIKKIRALGRKYKVVTGPQFSEIFLTEENKRELRMLVENTTRETHEFIKDANHFYFIIKHVFQNEPEPLFFCSIEPKEVITSEMIHNSNISSDFLQIPLEFNQLYYFLSRL